MWKVLALLQLEKLRQEAGGVVFIMRMFENPEVYQKLHPRKAAYELAHALAFVYQVKHLKWEEDVDEAAQMIECWVQGEFE